MAKPPIGGDTGITGDVAAATSVMAQRGTTVLELGTAASDMLGVTSAAVLSNLRVFAPKDTGGGLTSSSSIRANL